MKKAITAALLLSLCIAASAQLGRPTDTVKDTLFIIRCFYNGEEINMADSPADFLVESSSTIYIAGEEYKKGDRTDVNSLTQIITFLDATVNGKRATLVKKYENGLSAQPTRYIIDKYQFLVRKKRSSPINVDAARSKAGEIVAAAEQTLSIAGQEISNLFNGSGQQAESAEAGGWGIFDLNGRSVGPGGLVKPRYTAREEGRVVVNITVDPSGNVIATSINKRTNTSNVQIRNAAEYAAKRTKFNSISTSPNNQMGTITYYFKSK